MTIQEVKEHRVDSGDPTAATKSSVTSVDVQLDKIILETTESKGIISSIYKMHFIFG